MQGHKSQGQRSLAKVILSASNCNAYRVLLVAKTLLQVTEKVAQQSVGKAVASSILHCVIKETA